jgi:histone deacetylase 1/2
MSLLALRKWKGQQVDFTTAFLNGCLSEPVFMSQPPGFEDPQHPDWVCQVKQSTYGLKKSPREWNLKLHSALVLIGLTHESTYDPMLYFRLNGCCLVGALLSCCGGRLVC